MFLDFSKRVAEQQEALGSALCVGLDPNSKKIPRKYLGGTLLTEAVVRWMIDVVDLTAPYTTVFKLNLAYYENLDVDGMRVLVRILKYIREYYPEIPVILDGKRGDIDRTQAQYREALFGCYGAGSTTISPYMGREPLVAMYDPAHPERGLITLIYTSNKGAREVQDVTVVHPLSCLMMPYWLYIADRSLAWAKAAGIQNLNFVMAAAYDRDGEIYSEHLRGCREFDQGRIPYLVPGFGAQGGFVEATIQAGWNGWGSLMLSASSSISEAPNPGEAARDLSEQITRAITLKSRFV